MTLWKLRFALEFCKKAKCISKENSKRMILNAYISSKLHILIRRHWKRFSIYKPIPNYMIREIAECDSLAFEKYWNKKF